MKNKIIAAATASVMVLGIAGTATAAGADSGSSAAVGMRDLASAAQTVGPAKGKISRAEQRYLLALLFAGTGPLADAHPEMVDLLGFSADRPPTDKNALGELIRQYLDYDPDFVDTVATPLMSGDPMAVEQALVSLTATFQAFLQSTGQVQEPSGPSASGCSWRGCFAITLYVTANAAVYANAAVATNAVATLVLFWVYLMDAQGEATQIERDDFVAQLTAALSDAD